MRSSPVNAVVLRESVDQYAAASRFYHRRLWNTGSPGRGRAMTAEYVAAFSRRMAPELCQKLPALQTEGAGKTGCALHPRSRVQLHKRVRTRAYRSSGEHPAFPAQWFYGLYVISPVRRALLPPSPVRGLLLTNLAPASGARTTRLRRTPVPRASVAAPASTASPPHVRDDRERPSEWDGMGSDIG